MARDYAEVKSLLTANLNLCMNGTARLISVKESAEILNLLTRMRNCGNCEKRTMKPECVYCYDENGVFYDRGWEDPYINDDEIPFTTE